jgi:hypothetical protein|tara:strand:+ start:1485 stop:2339 length:855 start_codon:yes stop_codon:yes gene_type:complete
MPKKQATEAQIEIEEEAPLEDEEVSVEEEDSVTKPDDPKKYQERMNQIYGKMKEAERKNEEFSSTIDTMRQHNDKMLAAMERMSEAQEAGEDRRAANDELKSIDLQIKELKEARTEASKDEEFDKVDELSDEIGNLKQQKKELLAKPKTPAKVETPQQDTIDPATTTWLNATPWANEKSRDQKMFAVAIETEKELLMDPNWMHRSKADQLQEVRKRTEALFNYKSNGRGRPTTSAVEGAYHDSAGTPTKVKLTQEQLRIAKIYNITPERYAKQLLMEEQSRRPR